MVGVKKKKVIEMTAPKGKTYKRVYKLKENGKVNTGRPIRIDEQTIQKLEWAFSIDMDTTTALNYAMLKSSTYYDTLKNNEVFSQRIAFAKDTLKRKSLAVMADQLNSKNENNRRDAAKYILDRRDVRYIEKSEAKIEGDLKSDINLKEVTMIDLEEMRKKFLS